jgi:hypothetical protein
VAGVQDIECAGNEDFFHSTLSIADLLGVF